MSLALLSNGPYYGHSDWLVGFVDFEDGPEVVAAPRLTGLAAFRDAKRRCLEHVAEMAGPEYPVRVHKIKLEREPMLGRREPVIKMHVTTITTHMRIGGDS